MTVDAFRLQRFVDAQERDYETALAEISSGRKRSHWMWYVFPQIAGLGTSATAQHYAISGRPEAQAYLAHPVLGPRLRECCSAVMSLSGRSAHEIFGTPDDMKLRSSVTLFAEASPNESVFRHVIEKYFGGEPDPRTLVLLGLERADGRPTA